MEDQEHECVDQIYGTTSGFRRDSEKHQQVLRWAAKCLGSFSNVGWPH